MIKGQFLEMATSSWLVCKFLVLLTYFVTANARPQVAPQTSNAGFLNWMEHESHCGGQHQSPINIESDRAFIANFPDFTFHRYEQVFPEILENDGHTVELKIEQQGMGDRLPFITGGGLAHRYNFVQLHFHWGAGLSGSEHRINGKQFAGEVHIVHYNSRYGSFNNALPFPDGLAVLGIMIELQARDNVAFRHLEQFDNVINANSTDTLRFSVPLGDLLPENTNSFFRYSGSLTTGNCNEDVIWTVFDTPIAISERQLAKFRQLRDENGNQLRQNVRPTQLLHERVVMYRPDMTETTGFDPNSNPSGLFPNIFSAFPNVFQMN